MSNWSRDRVWIVEMKMEETGGDWEPTVWVRAFKKDNPGDKFRVRKYVRKEGK